MKLVLDDGTVHELAGFEPVVLDAALASFNATKEQIDYFDEATRQEVYAAYESLRSVVPFLG